MRPPWKAPVVGEATLALPPPIAATCSRYSSFLRSLSYYSFIKAATPDHVEYTHAIFHRGSADCLTRIQRKPTTSSKHPASSSRGGRGRGGAAGGGKRHRRHADDSEGESDEDFGGGHGEGRGGVRALASPPPPATLPAAAEPTRRSARMNSGSYVRPEFTGLDGDDPSASPGSRSESPPSRHAAEAVARYAVGRAPPHRGSGGRGGGLEGDDDDEVDEAGVWGRRRGGLAGRGRGTGRAAAPPPPPPPPPAPTVFAHRMLSMEAYEAEEARKPLPEGAWGSAPRAHLLSAAGGGGAAAASARRGGRGTGRGGAGGGRRPAHGGDYSDDGMSDEEGEEEEDDEGEGGAQGESGEEGDTSQAAWRAGARAGPAALPGRGGGKSVPHAAAAAAATSRTGSPTVPPRFSDGLLALSFGAEHLHGA